MIVYTKQVSQSSHGTLGIANDSEFSSSVKSVKTVSIESKHIKTYAPLNLLSKIFNFFGCLKNNKKQENNNNGSVNNIQNRPLPSIPNNYSDLPSSEEASEHIYDSIDDLPATSSSPEEASEHIYESIDNLLTTSSSLKSKTIGDLDNLMADLLASKQRLNSEESESIYADNSQPLKKEISEHIYTHLSHLKEEASEHIYDSIDDLPATSSSLKSKTIGDLDNLMADLLASKQRLNSEESESIYADNSQPLKKEISEHIYTHLSHLKEEASEHIYDSIDDLPATSSSLKSKTIGDLDNLMADLLASKQRLNSEESESIYADNSQPLKKEISEHIYTHLSHLKEEASEHIYDSIDDLPATSSSLKSKTIGDLDNLMADLLASKQRLNSEESESIYADNSQPLKKEISEHIYTHLSHLKEEASEHIYDSIDDLPATSSSLKSKTIGDLDNLMADLLASKQ